MRRCARLCDARSTHAVAGAGVRVARRRARRPTTWRRRGRARARAGGAGRRRPTSRPAGAGGSGGSWHSPPGENLTFSVLLRPARPAAEVPPLTLLAGAAVARGARRPRARAAAQVAERRRSSVEARDGRRRKLAGILTEMASAGDRAEHVVVGVGLNVNGLDFPPELADRATSLRAALGRAFDRAERARGRARGARAALRRLRARGPGGGGRGLRRARARSPTRCRVAARRRRARPRGRRPRRRSRRRPAACATTTGAFTAWFQESCRHDAFRSRGPGRRPGSDRVPAHLLDRAPAHRAGAARLGRPGRRLHRGPAARLAGGGDRLLPAATSCACCAPRWRALRRPLAARPSPPRASSAT